MPWLVIMIELKARFPATGRHMVRATWLLGGVVTLLATASAQGALSTPTALSGSQLGFARGGSIFLASRDGTKQRRVLLGKGDVSYRDPAWSGNGRLAVTQDYEPDEGMGSEGVIVIRPGRAPLDVPGGTSPFDGAPTWAPDNKQIALIGYNYGSPRGGFLYVNVPRTTGGSQPIDGDSQEDDLDDQPAWSPDGRRIAFARYLGGRFGLFYIAPDGSNRRQLTQRTAHNPSWSPDSRRIVFDDGHHIKVINIDGSGLNTLFTARPGDHASNPAWSPDGRLIAFDYGGPKGDQIWTMSPNGSHPHMVIRNARDPAWKRG